MLQTLFSHLTPSFAVFCFPIKVQDAPVDGGATLGFNLFFLLERDAERISSITFQAAANKPLLATINMKIIPLWEKPYKQTKKGLSQQRVKHEEYGVFDYLLPQQKNASRQQNLVDFRCWYRFLITLQDLRVEGNRAADWPTETQELWDSTYCTSCCTLKSYW